MAFTSILRERNLSSDGDGDGEMKNTVEMR